MELSLHGSQINLATRLKPSDQYRGGRPGSASIALNRCSSSASSSSTSRVRRRPFSADNNHTTNSSSSLFCAGSQQQQRTQLNNLSELGGKIGGRKPNIQNSSSNILNLLLSEPIRRSWTTSSRSTNSNNLSLGRRIKSKAIAHQMNENGSGRTTDDDESSIEEDVDAVQEVSDEESAKVDGKNWSIKPSKLKNNEAPVPADHKKFVTFSNNAEILSPEPLSHDDDDVVRKPDLPGRVSFSKTEEVYEIDFSDYENDTTDMADGGDNEQAAANRLEEIYKLHAIKPPESAPPTADESVETVKPIELVAAAAPPATTYCCPKKCNSLARDHEDDDDDNKSDKIDDQKIDNIVRSSELANRATSTDWQRNYKDFNNVAVIEPNPPSRIYNATDFQQAEAEKQKDSKSTGIPTRTVVAKRRASSARPVMSKLKETNRNRVNNSSVVTKTLTSSSDTKKSVTAKVNEREDNRLNEFEMDKVESWMSIHEFEKGGGGDEYNPSWRETPQSKTDDEGNYSFEDHLDGESTYDEIVSVIKEIDQDQKRQNSIHPFETAKLTLTDLQTPTSSVNNTASKYDKANQMDGANNETVAAQLQSSSSSSAIGHPDKMRQILSYLDDVDSSCAKTLHDAYACPPDSFRSEFEFEPDVIGDVPKLGDLVHMPAPQLARRIIALSMRANELSNAVQLSKEHMAAVRADKLKCVRAEKQGGQTRLAEQKKHFEGIVVRHQGFIEQLLKDKAELCEKLSAMARRMESQNQAWEHKLETEIQRTKETTMAGEKIRRERWVRENTKKIKELTVKGLEQEINRMSGMHQKEIAELKREHQKNVLDVVEEARQKHEHMEMGIRDSYAHDREAAIEKERNAIRERFERQMEADHKTFEDQKNRLLVEFAADKDRLHTELRMKELDFERRNSEMVHDKNEMIKHMKREFKDRIGMIENSNQASLQSMRDQYESDFTIWKREHEASLKMREVERENTIRKQCRIERDRQIDGIVAKVDAEALKHQHDFDLKISRMAEKHDSEIKELERAERQSRDKFNDVRARLAESEAMRQNVDATAKQLELQLHHVQTMYEALVKDKEAMREVVRNECQLEVATLKGERDIEIEKIYDRVQHAIEKKDAAIELLHKDNASLKERCVKLEALIRQQRKEYFSK